LSFQPPPGLSSTFAMNPVSFNVIDASSVSFSLPLFCNLRRWTDPPSENHLGGNSRILVVLASIPAFNYFTLAYLRCVSGAIFTSAEAFLLARSPVPDLGQLPPMYHFLIEALRRLTRLFPCPVRREGVPSASPARFFLFGPCCTSELSLFFFSPPFFFCLIFLSYFFLLSESCLPVPFCPPPLSWHCLPPSRRGGRA